MILMSSFLRLLGSKVDEKIVSPVNLIGNLVSFPHSMLPSASQITKNYEGLFMVEDWHVFTYDYSLTLKAWYENFSEGWPTLRLQYSERFYRMWCYYLLSFSGAFRARSIQIWQILLSKKGLGGRTKITR
jgi:cyclopropane-fatty-acyl-phospholipid synthase